MDRNRSEIPGPDLSQGEAELAPAQQALLFRALAEHSRNVVSIKDLDGRYLFVNHEYLRLFHRPTSDFIGHCDAELFAPEVAAIFRQNDLLVQTRATTLAVEETVPVDGASRSFLSLKFPIRDTAGALTATALIATDITGYKEAERRLWASEALFRQAFDHATVGMTVLDPKGVVLRANPRFCRMLGHTRETTEGRNIIEFAHPDDKSIGNDFRRRALAGGPTSAEFEKRFITRAGDTLYCRIASSLVCDDEEQPVFFVSHVTDITERRRIEAELVRLANTDPLTGVANRRPFLARLREELARVRRYGSPAGCLMLDFDHFKLINDRWGHSSGDAVLRHFSRVCRKRIRQTDLLGRLGGEEFAILMPATSLEGARELAEQLCRWIAAHPVRLGDEKISFSISIGVTDLRASDTSPDQVLRRCDAALYRAKEAGRNRVEQA
jgi:diguanylate cyclase (GGDEF)-like protein/PAS domain S-box-containing protein